MTNNIPLVSIVDDDNFVRDATSNLLLSLGYDVLTFASAEAFLSSGFVDHTSCLISDVRMPGMNGLELQKHLKEGGSCPPMIFITAHFCEKDRSRAFDVGAVAYFGKPFCEDELIDCITKILDAQWGVFRPCPSTIGNSK